jgi:hypothetical protein
MLGFSKDETANAVYIVFAPAVAGFTNQDSFNTPPLFRLVAAHVCAFSPFFEKTGDDGPERRPRTL